MPATDTGRQVSSAGTVNEATAASAHSTVPTTITGRGSRSLAGNSGAAFSGPVLLGTGLLDIASTLTDRRYA